MGQSVRKSRSIIGLSFEDQIAAIASTASIEEKILQITATSWSTASRIVQYAYDNQEANEDSAQADLVDHVLKSLGKMMIKNETLQSVKNCVGDMIKCSDTEPPK